MSEIEKEFADLPELPRPARTYADHSYPAYSKAQMVEYARAALAPALRERDLAALMHPAVAGMSPAGAIASLAIELDRSNDALTSLCQWLLHRFGPDSPEGREASARLAAQPAEPVQPDECAQDVYQHGVSIGLFDIPKETANAICAGITAATGARVDWHYIAGRVHMKAIANSATSAEPAHPDRQEECEHDLRAEYEGANGARATICAKCGERVTTRQGVALSDEWEIRVDGQRVRKDRWEDGFRSIVTIVRGPSGSFEIPEIIEMVRALALSRASSSRAEVEREGARDMLAALVDIYFDAMNNPPESRTYVDGAFGRQMNEASVWLAAAEAPNGENNG